MQLDLFIPPDQPVVCSTCNGVGHVSVWRKPWRDVIGGRQVTCRTCDGVGYRPAELALQVGE